MDPALRDAHPRPQLLRERWTDLCGAWGFATDDADAGLDDRWQEREDVFSRTIQVPFPPESPASGIGEPGFHPVVWYRRTFRAPHRPGERLLLHLGAVDYRAQVWVDGSLVATHEGGHTPFAADVTAALREQEEHVVVVRAEDLPGDQTQPRGKQDWLERPHVVWYERTTGIWQPVWLEPVPATRVSSVRWTPDLERAVLRVQVRLAGPARAGDRVRIRLSLRGEELVDDACAVVGATPAGATLQRDLALDGARIAHDRRAYLWSPRHPNLLDAVVSLERDGEVLDEVLSYVGLRSVGAARGRFLLNGRPFFLRLVLSQGYWPQSHLAAPDGDALRREAELVKELGFDGVRIHQKVEDPRFLHWCDRLGLLAWGEMPSAYDFGDEALERLTREWLEVLRRDASAPSLVTWVPFNESWGVPGLEHDEAQRSAVRALYSLTKAVDPSRLVVGNDGWEHLVSDVFGIHDYAADGAVLQERYGSEEAVERTLRTVQPYYHALLLADLATSGMPLVVSEFGGITHDPSGDDFWNGYGAASSAEELLERYTGLVDALLASPVVAGFCYTQLTDTGQERNGLLDEDRRPKVDPAAVAAVNQRPSAAVPADAIAEIQVVHAARRTAPEPG